MGKCVIEMVIKNKSPLSLSYVVVGVLFQYAFNQITLHHRLGADSSGKDITNSPPRDECVLLRNNVPG